MPDSDVFLLENSLLPANADTLAYQLEHLAINSLSADHLPVAEISQLWQPQTCPESLLPWLAWANGVKYWDESWSEQSRRGVIDNSFEVHRYQGTRYAIEKALQPLNFDSQIDEWFEVTPNAPPGTFTISVDISEQGITPEVIEFIHDSVGNNKRGSAHYNLTLNLSCTIAPKIAMTQIGSFLVTIEPWYASELLANTSISVGSGCLTLNDITVYPGTFPEDGLPDMPLMLVI